jgi:hypothetical protein
LRPFQRGRVGRTGLAPSPRLSGATIAAITEIDVVHEVASALASVCPAGVWRVPPLGGLPAGAPEADAEHVPCSKP